MLILQVIHALCVVAALSLGIFVLLNNQRRALNVFFFAFSLIMTGWLTCLGIAFYTTDEPQIIAAIQMSSILGAFAPFMFSMMRKAVMHPTRHWSQHLRRSKWESLAPLAAAALACTSFYLRGVTLPSPESRSSLPEPLYGPGIALYALYFALYLSYIAYRFVQNSRATRGIQRTEIQFLLFGGFSGIVIAVLTAVVVPILTSTSLSVQYAPLAAFFLIGIIAYGIATRHIMEVADVLRRVTAYALLTGYLVALYCCVWAVLRWALEPMPWRDFGAHLIAALVVAFSMAPAHGQLQQFANRLFLSLEALGVTETLQSASRIVTSIGTRSELLEHFAELAAKLVGADRVLILLHENNHFVQSHPAPQEDRIQLDAENPLPRTLAEYSAPLAAETLQRFQASRQEIQAGHVISSLKSVIAVGIYANNVLKGIVLLGPRLSGRIYGQTEQRTLQVLCNQLAVGLENADLYTQIKDSAIYNDILLDRVVAGIIATNHEGRITVCNREAQRILHLSESLVQQPIQNLPPSLAHALQATLAGDIGRRNVETSLSVNGTDNLPVRFSTVAFSGHTGRQLGALLVFEDLTLLKKLEEQVRRTDRLASIGTLSAGMAHEIKNPLVTLKTFTQLLPDRYDDEDFRQTFSLLVGQEVKRIDSIVNQLLRFARPAKPSLHPTRVHEVLTSSLQIIQQQLKQKQIDLHQSYAEQSDVIRGDANLLTQAFVNFFLNAIDAMENGGTLTVATEHVEIETPQMTLQGSFTTETRLRVAISDTGAGIKREDIPHVFDPFFTTKSSGTGLGLSVSHSIISEHNGLLEVESEPGKGSTFYLLFPLAPAEVAP